MTLYMPAMFMTGSKADDIGWASAHAVHHFQEDRAIRGGDNAVIGHDQQTGAEQAGTKLKSMSPGTEVEADIVANDDAICGRNLLIAQLQRPIDDNDKLDLQTRPLQLLNIRQHVRLQSSRRSVGNKKRRLATRSQAHFLHDYASCVRHQSAVKLARIGCSSFLSTEFYVVNKRIQSGTGYVGIGRKVEIRIEFRTGISIFTTPIDYIMQ
ncbi:hypothetical protein WK91_03440 [Burkholderia cepacia]|nr:hypothetical protein WK91_03440 [Burkholderia cepacia]